MKPSACSFFITLSLLLPACAGEDKKSDSVTSDEIYQGYSVVYREEDNSLTAKAEFRAGAQWDRMETEKTGGTAVALTSPAGITFNGENMEQKKDVFTGGYYELKKSGTFDGKYEWVWTDNSGKKFTNSAKLNSISIENFPNEMNVQNEIEIKWKGVPVQENEQVEVWITGPGSVDEKQKVHEFTGERGATSLVISAGELRNFKSSFAKIEIKRNLLMPVAEGGKEGGMIKLTYEAKTRNVNLRGRSLLNF